MLGFGFAPCLFLFGRNVDSLLHTVRVDGSNILVLRQIVTDDAGRVDRFELFRSILACVFTRNPMCLAGQLPVSCLAGNARLVLTG